MRFAKPQYYMETHTEEDYIKVIYKLSRKKPGGGVSTKAISDTLKNRASTVTDMMQKLAEKRLVNYIKYKGVTLTGSGEKVALKIIRKHRLWETFLVRSLDFQWDEVHEIAEQLEHIHSPELIDRLDNFLDYPMFDPHGDPIPDKNGRIRQQYEDSLDGLRAGQKATVKGISDPSDSLLKYLAQNEVGIGTIVEKIESFDYDGSVVVRLANGSEVTFSQKVACSLLVDQLDLNSLP